MKNLRFAAVTIAVTMLMFALLLTAVAGGGGAMAAPMAAPTPIAVLNTSALPASEAAFLDNVVLTSATTGGSVQVKDFEFADIQYNIDIGSSPATTTIKLQFSNDAVNWTDGVLLVSAASADASVLSQTPVFGKFARANVAVSGTNTLTVSVLAILK